MKKLLLLFILLLLPFSSYGATYGQKMVAAVLIAEAGGEGERGIIAVAEVIRTRADLKKRSPLAIIKEKSQFSALNNISVENLHKRARRHKMYDKALAIARMMYNTPEKLPGYSNGATHYDHYKLRPYWTRGHTPVARVGNHLFYRIRS